MASVRMAHTFAAVANARPTPRFFSAASHLSTSPSSASRTHSMSSALTSTMASWPNVVAPFRTFVGEIHFNHCWWSRSAVETFPRRLRMKRSYQVSAVSFAGAVSALANFARHMSAAPSSCEGTRRGHRLRRDTHGPNQVVRASRRPWSVPSPTHATCPSGRINTAVGAATAPSTGSSHTPAYRASTR